MAIWMDKVNRIRLASMGLTKQLWSADWARLFEIVQDKSAKFQAEADDLGQAIVTEHAFFRPFAFLPICRALGAVDLVWYTGREWFSDMVKSGQSVKLGSTVGSAKSGGRSKGTSRGRSSVSGAKTSEKKRSQKPKHSSKKTVAGGGRAKSVSRVSVGKAASGNSARAQAAASASVGRVSTSRGASSSRSSSVNKTVKSSRSPSGPRKSK
jgi:hypothetical protein